MAFDHQLEDRQAPAAQTINTNYPDAFNRTSGAKYLTPALRANSNFVSIPASNDEPDMDMGADADVDDISKILIGAKAITGKAFTSSNRSDDDNGNNGSSSGNAGNAQDDLDAEDNFEALQEAQWEASLTAAQWHKMDDWLNDREHAEELKRELIRNNDCSIEDADSLADKITKVVKLERQHKMHEEQPYKVPDITDKNKLWLKNTLKERGVRDGLEIVGRRSNAMNQHDLSTEQTDKGYIDTSEEAGARAVSNTNSIQSRASALSSLEQQPQDGDKFTQNPITATAITAHFNQNVSNAAAAPASAQAQIQPSAETPLETKQPKTAASTSNYQFGGLG